MRRFAWACLALWAAAATAAPLASTPLSREDLPWWKKRFAAKAEELRHGPFDLVFYGDSITQNFEMSSPQAWRNFTPVWQHYYSGRHAINLGFVGDTTAHLLWRIGHGEASGIAPKAAVVLIGANNFGRLHWPAGQTEPAIEKIIADLRTRLPGTHILLLGVLPSLRSPWVDRNTAELNQALAVRYRDGQEATYLDLSPLFLRGGKVDPTKFMDPLVSPKAPPLHPSAQTAAAMAAAMEPILSRWLGDSPRAPM